MAIALFPNEPVAELERGMRLWLTRDDSAVFIAERPDGSACGFVEVGSRSYAEGCESSPVGYIEAWYVDPDVRRAGCGRALLAAAEDWARGMGYTEMGSDVALDNAISHRAHTAIGYTETDRIITFRKSLTSP